MNTFLSSLTKATEKGVPVDVFTELWQKERTNELEERAWERRKEEREWFPDPGHLRQRPFNRQGMKIQRRMANGMILDDGLPTGLEEEADAEPQTPSLITCPMSPLGNHMIENLKEISIGQSSPGQPEPRAASPPPKYHELKGIAALELPHNNVQRIDENQQTEIKVIADVEALPASKLDELTRVISELHKEQMRIRKLHEEHEVHLKDLMHREPSVHKRVSTLRLGVSESSLRRKIIDKKKRDLPPLPEPHGSQLGTNPSKTTASDLDMYKSSHLYVQIETLYNNFARMHFPFDQGFRQSKKSLFGGDKTGGQKEDDYDEVTDLYLMESLQHENKSLAEKVEELEKELKRKESSSAHAEFSANTKGQWEENSHKDVQSPDSYLVGKATSPQWVAFSSMKPVEMTFLWTIPDYAKKRRMESCGERENEISMPFYLTHRGYRAQLEAYLNGNGSGKGKCMSIFLRIIKGDYDCNLKWPAELTFIVILINQKDGANESLKAVTPNGTSFRFNRPAGSTDADSDSWGFIKFVGHDLISTKNYIHEDKVALRCRIISAN